MFSKEEATRLRQQFWINFGQYMKPIPGAEGLPVNWVNYKTGVKNIFFRMDAEKKHASIAIEIAHPDDGIRELFFEQFQEFKSLLESTLNEQWEWLPSTSNAFYKQVARIECVLPNVSVYNQQQWPDIIAFLKPRIIALDEFWTDVKPVFEDLK
ncbi:MAG: DUF4268 domain-containing protein [Pedobacter sp.]|uniref:DUF4268 domain-containing protein n=1 Tax=Pedobacter sp. TaxID=1411316 RepID=UPI002808C078|nr:DUF4268 domain-containing protein [Pedobacter sp.]MDQ8005213.1 DUF4268 domain-containing protein [Pedobacter sp.]